MEEEISLGERDTYLVTAASTQLLSVKIARPSIGELAPRSQILMHACVQSKAYVEFWDKTTLMFLTTLPLLDDFPALNRFLSGISSILVESSMLED